MSHSITENEPEIQNASRTHWLLGGRLPGGSHGGNVDEWAARTGRPAASWLDLSTGINPVPYPLPDGLNDRIALWRDLPTADALTDVTQAAAAYYDAPHVDWVAMVPGTQLIIQLLPLVLPRVLPRVINTKTPPISIVGPTYGEHERCWRLAGQDVQIVQDLPKPGPMVVVVVNPNNPDGRTYSPEDLLAWASAAKVLGGFLIVDEAFCDLVPDSSVVPRLNAVPRENVAVLKSFGKFFGMAGLRLGALIAHPSLTQHMAMLLGPWALSAPAMEVGRIAYQDQTWISDTRSQLVNKIDEIKRLYQSVGLKVSGGTDLYAYLESQDAASLFDHLVGQGVLLRRFDDRPHHLRSGLPGTAQEWARLRDALHGWQV